ncbi:hypothetical protein EC991_002981 [Linnemannia zychae]|nr:hypothetical protein EC991_002981 [Linnemannia zychae]
MNYLRSIIYGTTADQANNGNSQTTDMDSMPDLAHSDDFTSQGSMDLDDNDSNSKTRSLEDHKARIPAYGNQLQQDQLQRQRDHQARIQAQQEQAELEHLRHLQDPETDMPSLSYSTNSSHSSSKYQSSGQERSWPPPAEPVAIQPQAGARGIFDMASAAGLGGGAGGAMAAVPGVAADGYIGGQGGGGGGPAGPQFLDHELFLTSVLNAIAPWMDRPDGGAGNPLQFFDYQSEFTQRQMLAVGGNGEIRKAFWGSRNCFVVLKSLLDTKKNTAAKNASMFDKEVEVMMLCGNHDNIVQFYGVANKHHPDHRIERFMVMQFYDLGDLNKLIHLPRSAHESPSMHERMILALDIAVGLEHLTKCGFHHGDLHPKNVLIDTRYPYGAAALGGGRQPPRYQARLTDFGLRRIRGSLAAQSSQPLGGVWQFMAPERFVNKGVTRPRYDIRCDIFALGVIYWFILAGRYPFKDKSIYTPGREERTEGTPDWYYALYSKAWKEDANKRQQSFDEIIQVFQRQLGIPAGAAPVGESTMSGVAGQGASAGVGANLQAYPSPPYAHGSPLIGSGPSARGAVGGSGRGSSLNPPPSQGANGNLPSPALSSASAARSGPSVGGSPNPSNKPSPRHPDHPSKRKIPIPDGRQGRLLGK